AVLPPTTEGESGRIARRLENGDGVEQHQLDIAQENVLRKRYDIGDDIEVRIVNDWINGTIQKVYLREKGALKSNKLTYYDVLVDPYIKAVSRYQLKKIYKKKDLLLIRDPSNGEQKEGFVVDVNEDTETYTIKYRADAVDGKGGSREEELALKFSSDQYSHRDHEVFSVGEESHALCSGRRRGHDQRGGGLERGRRGPVPGRVRLPAGAPPRAPQRPPRPSGCAGSPTPALPR
ncbi:unnamed protein product, partial [Heterosigma akashiwo]